jgi:hypothetical protein
MKNKTRNKCYTTIFPLSTFFCHILKKNFFFFWFIWNMILILKHFLNFFLQFWQALKTCYHLKLNPSWDTCQWCKMKNKIKIKWVVCIHKEKGYNYNLKMYTNIKVYGIGLLCLWVQRKGVCPMRLLEWELEINLKS